MKDLRIKKIYRPTFVEGVFWTLAGIKDAVVVFHSPGGCYVSQMQTLLSLDEPYADFYTSNLSMPSLIISGEDRLKSVLEKAKVNSSDCLFVIDSVPASMIKEDLDGVVECFGFKNAVVLNVDSDKTLNEGRDYALLRLLPMMQKGLEKKDKTVNIIGPTCCMYNWRSDVAEIKRVLNDIGVSVNTVLCAGCTLEQIKKAPQARLNLCVYPHDCGLSLAKKMESSFNIPYFKDVVPIGFEQTANWLEQVAQFFSLDPNDYLKKQMKEAMRFMDSNFIFSVSHDSKAALSVQNHNTYALGISRFLQNELGTEVSAVITTDKNIHSKLRNDVGRVLFSPDINQIRSLFIEVCPTVVLGSFYEFAITKEVGIKNFLYCDIPMPKNIITQSSPYMGFRGAVNLIQQIATQTISSLFIDAKSDTDVELGKSVVKWEPFAISALGEIAEMIPYFVRTVAIKKIKLEAEQLAKKLATPVDTDILRRSLEKNSHFRNNQKVDMIFKKQNQA